MLLSLRQLIAVLHLEPRVIRPDTRLRFGEPRP